MSDSERYRFGPFLLDVNEGRLRRGGAPVPLTGKAFDLLVALVRGAGRTLTKAELMAALWPDTVVEESNLTQTVFVLRKAMGEDPEGAAYVRTVPRQGYRFMAAVSVEGPSPETKMAPPRRWRKYATGSVLLAVLAGEQCSSR